MRTHPCLFLLLWLAFAVPIYVDVFLRMIPRGQVMMVSGKGNVMHVCGVVFVFCFFAGCISKFLSILKGKHLLTVLHMKPIPVLSLCFDGKGGKRKKGVYACITT